MIENLTSVCSTVVNVFMVEDTFTRYKINIEKLTHHVQKELFHRYRLRLYEQDGYRHLYLNRHWAMVTVLNPILIDTYIC